MATATTSVSFGLATVAVSGTAVAPTTTIPDNCHTIIILNRGAGVALFGRAAPGAGALTEGTNAMRMAADAIIQLRIGTIEVRGPMVEADLAGSGFVYDGTGGTTPTLDILYLNTLSNSADAAATTP